MACSSAAVTCCSSSSAASSGPAAFKAPGNFSTAFRSGSALTPNSSAAWRNALRYPPTSSRLTANSAPPARSTPSVTSMCPRCRRSFSTRRTFISTASSSAGIRRCKSRKRWFTDLRLSVIVSWSFTCVLTCAYPVIERMFIAGSLAPIGHLNIHELQIVQAAIGAGMGHQPLVRAFVGDHAVLQHEDAVGLAHGREPVRNDKHRASGHQVL